MSGADQPLLVERRGHVVVLTLNRPARHNAVDAALTQALAAAVRDTEADAEVRAVVLAAVGPTFCAGADLTEVAQGRAEALRTAEGGFAGFAEAARRKPWIAACTGRALGGGLELALACDLRVAGSEAVFGLPEVKRGLFAGAGGLYRLPKQIPRAIALEMIATGEPIGAARAAELGLVNRVAPAADVLEVALALAQAIAENAPLAGQHSLAIARAAADRPEAESVAAGRAAFAALVESEDFAEGPRAFVEKRRPRWTGR